MPPLNWALLSTARINRALIPPLKVSERNKLYGVASRDKAKADAFAAEHGIPHTYGSYEEMLADPNVDVVYVPVPNHLHAEWSIKAMQAGKHVLCEKPFALHAADLDVLRPYATRVHIREAFMVRHHPQWLEVRERVRRGEIGELRTLMVPFCYFNADPANIRNRADVGGGALYDIGCYAITAGRWFFEAEPGRVIALVDRDPALGTDRTTSGILDFGAGRQLVFSVSTQSVRYQRVQLIGSRGRIEIEIPFNAPEAAPTRYWLDRSGAADGSGVEVFTLPVADHYQLQAEPFSRAVRHERPDAAGLDDAIAGMKVIDALFASERSGRFERP